MSETKEDYTTTKTKSVKTKFLLHIPKDLLIYYRQLAEEEGRFISAQMVFALEASRAARDDQGMKMATRKMNKREIYEAEISPLMEKIIDICRANGIAFLASFALPTEEEAIMCTTALLGDEYQPPDELRQALKVITTK